MRGYLGNMVVDDLEEEEDDDWGEGYLGEYRGWKNRVPDLNKRAERKVRQVNIKSDLADACVSGKTQASVAKKYGLTRQRVCAIAKGEDMVPFIEAAQMRLLAALPCAVDNTKKLVEGMDGWKVSDSKNRQLSYDASKLVMQAGGIVPTSSQTTVVTNILNQANIVPSPQVMEILKLHQKGMADFVDVKELDGDDSVEVS